MGSSNTREGARAARTSKNLELQRFRQAKPTRDLAFEFIEKAVGGEISDVERERKRQGLPDLFVGQTGSLPSAFVPIVANQVQAVQRGVSQAKRSAQENFAQAGLTGSSFAAQQLTELDRAGAFGAQQAEVSALQRLQDFGLATAFGESAAALQGVRAAAPILNQAGALDLQRRQQNVSIGGQAIGSVLGSVGSILGAIGGGGSGSPVAAPALSPTQPGAALATPGPTSIMAPAAKLSPSPPIDLPGLGGLKMPKERSVLQRISGVLTDIGQGIQSGFKGVNDRRAAQAQAEAEAEQRMTLAKTRIEAQKALQQNAISAQQKLAEQNAVADVIFESMKQGDIGFLQTKAGQKALKGLPEGLQALVPSIAQAQAQVGQGIEAELAREQAAATQDIQVPTAGFGGQGLGGVQFGSEEVSVDTRPRAVQESARGIRRKIEAGQIGQAQQAFAQHAGIAEQSELRALSKRYLKAQIAEKEANAAKLRAGAMAGLSSGSSNARKGFEDLVFDNAKSLRETLEGNGVPSLVAGQMASAMAAASLNPDRQGDIMGSLSPEHLQILGAMPAGAQAKIAGGVTSAAANGSSAAFTKQLTDIVSSTAEKGESIEVGSPTANLMLSASEQHNSVVTNSIRATMAAAINAGAQPGDAAWQVAKDKARELAKNYAFMSRTDKSIWTKLGVSNANIKPVMAGQIEATEDYDPINNIGGGQPQQIAEGLSFQVSPQTGEIVFSDDQPDDIPPPSDRPEDIEANVRDSLGLDKAPVAAGPGGIEGAIEAVTDPDQLAPVVEGVGNAVTEVFEALGISDERAGETRTEVINGQRVEISGSSGAGVRKFLAKAVLAPARLAGGIGGVFASDLSGKVDQRKLATVKSLTAEAKQQVNKMPEVRAEKTYSRLLRQYVKANGEPGWGIQQKVRFAALALRLGEDIPDLGPDARAGG